MLSLVPRGDEGKLQHAVHCTGTAVKASISFEAQGSTPLTIKNIDLANDKQSEAK